MSERPTIRIALILSVIITAFINMSTGLAADLCSAVSVTCYYKCSKICKADDECYSNCSADCDSDYQKCTAGHPKQSSPAGNVLPPGTTLTPPKHEGELPINVGVNPPGGGTSPPKGGVMGVHPVYPGNPVGVNPPVEVNQPNTGSPPGRPIYDKSGAGQQVENKLNVQDLIKSWKQKVNQGASVLTPGQIPRGEGSISPKVKSHEVNQPNTGSPPGRPIYDKSGAGQQVENKLNVQDLIKSWKQKVNQGASVLTPGQVPRGEGSISPKVKSHIFNQTNQTSPRRGSGTQELQNETLHMD